MIEIALHELGLMAASTYSLDFWKVFGL